jgi:feruloyl-CoA synthase
VRRAALLTVAPSLDRGEITDKGSINQRAVLAGHAGAVAELYLAIAPEHVAVIDPAATR